MSKTLDQLSIEEVVKECLHQHFQDHDDNFEHDIMPEYVPWGDTYVKAFGCPTEQSEIKCEEAFIQDFDVDYFITEYLAENQDFRDKLIEMVNQRKFYGV